MYELQPPPRRLGPLVHATSELRALSAVLAAGGAALVVATLAAGHLGRLTPLEIADVVILLGIVSAACVAAGTLGRRTGPRIVYRNILDQAPLPPGPAVDEPERRTRTRALLVGALTVVAFVGAAAVGSVLALAAMGKARDDIPDHLLVISTLIGGGWALVCAAAAWVIGRWLAAWEQMRKRTILCAPLRAATLGEVYFTRPTGTLGQEMAHTPPESQIPRAAELARAMWPDEIDMVEFVRSGTGLPPGALRRIDPELEVEFHPMVLDAAPPTRGMEEFVRGWSVWLEPYERYVVAMEEFIDAGPDEVLIPVQVRARTRRDGVTIEHAPAAVATFRNGVLVRMRFYLDRDEAAAAAGLSSGTDQHSP